jgi:outer membrane protein assembly factor BamB
MTRRGISSWGALLLVSLAAGCGGGGAHQEPPDDAGATNTPSDSAGSAVAYQIDVGHSGNQPESTFRPPLQRQWALSLGEMASYPVIVDGRVFVTAKDNASNGTNLYAIGIETGEILWGPAALPGNYGWSAPAYAGGRIFVLGDAGYLGAFDAATGTSIWAVRVPDIYPAAYIFDSPPTVAGETLFLSGSGSPGGTVFAIATDTGRLRWKVPVTTGSDSSPAIGDEAVFVSSGCEEVSALAPDDGSTLWKAPGKCSGGGGTPVINGDRVWVIGPTFPQYETTNTVFDRRSGAPIRLFEASRSPAFAGSHGFFVAGHKVTKVDLTTDATEWTFSIDSGGFRAPIVANGHVYVVSVDDGMLYAIDAASGQAVWSDKVSDFISSESDTSGWVAFGLAADQKHLIVPGRDQLIAYR